MKTLENQGFSSDGQQEINEDMRQSITKKLIEALPQFPLEEMEKGNVR